ncbi:hypothetical protein C0992_008713 [Termitomyces sp. T32_za158]|nr:hypothetical protein C0992_008713 [Termitomyces sp. T32_za158]
MGTEVLLQCLEAARQPVPPMALFLQDNLAIMVMEGLLNQIEFMRKQRVSALEQINRTVKCKLSSPEEGSAHELKVLPVPVEDIFLDQQDEEMDKVLWFKDELELMDHFDPIIPSAGKKVGPTSRSLARLTHASNTPGPLKNYWGCKPPILIDNLELIDFPTNILEWAEAAQLLFMKKVVFLVLPAQLTVVKLTTDLHIPAQYDGLVATMAVDKEKQCHNLPLGHHPGTPPHLLASTVLSRHHYPAAHRTPTLSNAQIPWGPDPDPGHHHINPD